MRNLKMTLWYEIKEYVLIIPILEIDIEIATQEEITAQNIHIDDATKVSYIMIATMAPNLQNSYEEYWPYEMKKSLG